MDVHAWAAATVPALAGPWRPFGSIAPLARARAPVGPTIARVRPIPLGGRPWTSYGDAMRWWTASCLALTALAATLGASSPARAAEPSASEASSGGTATEAPPRRPRDRVRALEVQGLAMTQILPRPGFGADVAFVFGHPNVQARVGAMVVGVPAFELGQGTVANVLQAGQLDVCAAKPVLHHQIRMCVGGQAGGMAHLWKGYERPGRSMTVWAAGTLKGDYQVRLTDHFGVIGGVGMVQPVVGPSFRAYDAYGTPTPMVFPGPIAGWLSLGTAFRW